jgi:hypothetical protein
MRIRQVVVRQAEKSAEIGKNRKQDENSFVYFLGVCIRFERSDKLLLGDGRMFRKTG